MFAISRSKVIASSTRCFSTLESAGVKIAAQQEGASAYGSKLSVVVRGGSRYNTKPGVAHVLEKFAFKNNNHKSALRLTREAELVGAQLTSGVSRENIVLSANFLKEDLEYFVQNLGAVVNGTVFNKYELVERVAPLVAAEVNHANSDPVYLATEAAYETAFRSGLGNSVLAEAHSPVTIEDVVDYASKVYNKSNIALVASGVIPADLQKFVANSYFAELSAGSALKAESVKTFSGESRIKAAGVNAVTVAFPIQGASSAALAVLAKVVGGKSHIKWANSSSLLGSVAGGVEVSTSVASFSDASLFYITISGASASAVSSAAKEAVAAIKTAAAGVSDAALAAANAQAKLEAAAVFESFSNEIVGQQALSGSKVGLASLAKVSAEQVKDAAASLLKGKTVVSVVGNTHELPHADELF
ncbi:LuxS/MPP-like metallohydrolase [Nadsonia fulvescens var. elongata DSM 6958]|uniref:Cytochrome b-c1 complex subunit 2, mitochondrial n=1 Tax=Nadsonia fulvescens var. elongata DSM 6958 TaxID=857566 RepID=A0A1E3PLR9_9ASCO|nr:LuxS/MPP-like metallohydrolase [Nadsonia fulvescens var. elongata DSM 6958]